MFLPKKKMPCGVITAREGLTLIITVNCDK